MKPHESLEVNLLMIFAMCSSDSLLVRENREGLDEPRPRSIFGTLEDIPVVNGRLEVLNIWLRLSWRSTLLGALWTALSYAVGDTGGALEALNKALDIDASMTPSCIISVE